MKRRVLPVLGVLAAIWAAASVVRTAPRRQPTEPPAPPPVSDYPTTIPAVGLVEASTENISIGTPLAGVVTKVFVTPGDEVKTGEPLFVLDQRQLRADLVVKQQAALVAQSRVAVSLARLQDLERQFEFAEHVKDARAVSAEEVSRRRSAAETGGAEVAEARAQLLAAQAQASAAQIEIERSTIRAPLDAEVLQVKVRVGEYAPAAATTAPLVVLGKSKPLHVRVDVDEHEGWKLRPGAEATAHLRGNADLKTALEFVRFEPFVVPKRSLTGDSTERVDTRVLQVIYRVSRDDLPLFIGQQLDVFIDGRPGRTESR